MGNFIHLSILPSSPCGRPVASHVGPATPLALCLIPSLSQLSRTSSFRHQYTLPAPQQMLCLYMAVSAQPRRRIPFKRLGGCHSDSRLGLLPHIGCPLCRLASPARRPVRFIYASLRVIGGGGRGETLALGVLRGVCFQRNI